MLSAVAPQKQPSLQSAKLKMVEYCYAECHLMLSITYEPFMLNVIMLSAVAPQKQPSLQSAKFKMVEYCYAENHI
jgi:microcompartment protein CcmK/EutM